MRNIRDSKGFTLIELMIVVVIIGILAAIAIPKFSGASKQARQSEAESVLKQMYTLQGAHFEKYNAFAADSASLARVGWEEPNAKYFDFALGATTTTAGAETACLSAGQKAGVTTVDVRSMRANRAAGATDDRAIYATADCTGTRLDQ